MADPILTAEVVLRQAQLTGVVATLDGMINRH